MDSTGGISRWHQETASMFPVSLVLSLALATPSVSPGALSSVGTAAARKATGSDVASSNVRHLDVTLSDIDAAQLGSLLGDSVPAYLRDRLKGRIGKVVVAVRGDQVTMKAEQFRLNGDWLARAEGTADLKARTYK